MCVRNGLINLLSIKNLNTSIKKEKAVSSQKRLFALGNLIFDTYNFSPIIVNFRVFNTALVRFTVLIL
jgi:hypothetical protein